MPAHGRVDVARVCLRQLARTCEELREGGIFATAVVMADDENLETARDLEFATIERENSPLGRKWNDGYELACSSELPAHRRKFAWLPWRRAQSCVNPYPADFVIPFGSDDWIVPELVELQVRSRGSELRCSRLSCVVNENATKLRRLRVHYPGRLDFGDGVRVIPSWLLQAVGYRPADESADRALDASVFRKLERLLARPPRVLFNDLGWHQIVDWKTHDHQLNPYEGCSQVFGEGPELEPFQALARHYPAEALDEMRTLHAGLVAA